jgi:hypothetical protein
LYIHILVFQRCFVKTPMDCPLKDGRLQLLGRTGEQNSYAGFRESAGFWDPVRPFR